MGCEVQLEFNLEDKTSEEMKLHLMQKQIDEMHDSMGKVRRRLFAEVGELKKLYVNLKVQNEYLQTLVRELRNERTEWVYGQNGCLFDVREVEKSAC